ncbi:MAG: SPOR domain-containing protein, partial [Alphaproteobacteria bacterium]|nr:SPOR domain-containing protein [Alphaproteobacteria bacterium]
MIQLRELAPLVLLAFAPLALGGCGSMGSDMRPSGPPQFAELMPVAMAAPPPPPPPAAPPPAAAPPMSSGPMYGGHLASYSREADAIRGWNSIVRQHSSIGTLKRHLIGADTPKGRMLRVIAGDFPTLDEANRFCTWAKQQNLYCAVMQLSADGMMASPLPPPSRPARATRAAPAMAPSMAPAPAPAPMATPPASPMMAPATTPMAPPATGPATPLTAPRG